VRLMLELAILGLLHDQELHGYEIRRRLRDELGLFANISFGSLYPALSRLESSGLVAVTESAGGPVAPPIPPTGSLSGDRAGLRARRAVAPRGTKRSRKVYRITSEGRERFEALLDAEESPGSDDAKSFGLRLAFARYLPPQARLALLERRRAQLTRRLAKDRQRGADSTLDVYARSLVVHGAELTEHDIAWLDQLIELERQMQLTPRSDSREPRRGTARTTTKGTDR
jgi:DNA-binding PadR family transcriptional regulator